MGFLANFTKAAETFSNNVLVFQNICELYKSVLDKNYGGRFCIGRHCKTIFMIEVKVGKSDNSWGQGQKCSIAEKRPRSKLRR